MTPRGVLAAIGAPVRRRFGLLLAVSALAAHVAAQVPRPDAWRRPVRAEFRRTLAQAAGGGLSAVLLTATIVGLAAVYQAIYWLSVAGQEGAVGRVIVLVLVREVAPLLVGFILLGRSGMPMLVEIGALQSAGQVRALAGLGLDPFRLLVLPRAAALAAASFALGVLFVLVALTAGFVAGALLGVVRLGPFEFLSAVLRAMSARDFAVFPVKLLLIGLLVALTACETALATPRGAPAATLLPLGFARGIVAVLLASILLTLAI